MLNLCLKNHFHSQHVFQCKSSTRCADERTARGDDGLITEGHSCLVPEQTLQAQQENECIKNSDGTREGEKVIKSSDSSNLYTLTSPGNETDRLWTHAWSATGGYKSR